MTDSEYEQGKRQGRVDATLEHHSRRLTEINGNIKQFATEVLDLKTTVATSMSKLEGSISDLRSDQAAAAAKAQTVAETLAKEKARLQGERDERSAVAENRWTVRSSKATVASVFVGLAAGSVAVFETFWLFYH